MSIPLRQRPQLMVQPHWRQPSAAPTTTSTSTTAASSSYPNGYRHSNPFASLPITFSTSTSAALVSYTSTTTASTATTHIYPDANAYS